MSQERDELLQIDDRCACCGVESPDWESCEIFGWYSDLVEEPPHIAVWCPECGPLQKDALHINHELRRIVVELNGGFLQ